jgi:RNA 2',3'-cyclic 3'-phosphodiesterase
MSKRLFIAIELPKACREELAALDPRIKGLRWLPESQLHLTMSFLGDVANDREEKLRAELTAVRVPEFFLPIRGMGAFGGSRPTVVWAGVGTGHPHLFALHHHLQDAVLRAAIEPDLRPFHPHVTLGRAKGVSRASLLPLLRRHAETEFDMVKVSGFVLCSSELDPAGAVHTVELRREF